MAIFLGSFAAGENQIIWVKCSSKSQKSVLLNNWTQSNLKLNTPNDDLYACTPLKQESKLEPQIASINKSTDKPLTFL